MRKATKNLSENWEHVRNGHPLGRNTRPDFIWDKRQVISTTNVFSSSRRNEDVASSNTFPTEDWKSFRDSRESDAS